MVANAGREKENVGGHVIRVAWCVKEIEEVRRLFPHYG